jgi:hypothetical protein
VARRIKTKLEEKVPKHQKTGTLSNDPNSFVGQLTSKVLGSYGLNINYTLSWNAGAWEKRWYSFITGDRCYREVKTEVTVRYTNNTDWNFNWNTEYNWYENITQEVIPGTIAGVRGNPSGFFISLDLSETYDLKIEQEL